MGRNLYSSLSIGPTIKFNSQFSSFCIHLIFPFWCDSILEDTLSFNLETIKADPYSHFNVLRFIFRKALINPLDNSIFTIIEQLTNSLCSQVNSLRDCGNTIPVQPESFSSRECTDLLERIQVPFLLVLFVVELHLLIDRPAVFQFMDSNLLRTHISNWVCKVSLCQNVKLRHRNPPYFWARILRWCGTVLGITNTAIFLLSKHFHSMWMILSDWYWWGVSAGMCVLGLRNE